MTMWLYGLDYEIWHVQYMFDGQARLHPNAVSLYDKNPPKFMAPIPNLV